MNKLLLSKLFTFSIILFSLNTSAQTQCSNALPLTINGSCVTSASIADATQNLPLISNTSPCTFASVFRRERWYTFTVSSGSTPITITASASNQNLYLQLINSSDNTCTGFLSQIACANTNDTNNSAQTETISTTLNNGTYYLKVVNVGTNANMNLTNLCITSPPSNTSCATATSLPCGTSNLAGTTVGTTGASAHGSGCSMSNFGVWYTFVGDGQQTTITTNPSFDIKLSVATGSCGTFTNIACTDTSPETATFNTVAGINYYVYIADWSTSGTTTGAFTISRSCTPAPTPPANATCTTATSLPCGTSNLAGTTVGTTGVSAHGTGCSMSNYGVWYTFVGDGQQTTITTNPSFDIKLSVATGSSCGTFTNIACTDTSPETATFTTVAGTTYYVYIAHWSTSGSTTGTFTISRSCTPASIIPSNATCATATSLSCGTSNLAGTTVGTTGAAAHGTGCSMSNYGVWYSFIGNGFPTTITSTAGSGFDHEMSIASGSCGSLTNITCQDSGLSGGNESYTFTPTNGVTYYVYVAHYSNFGNTTGTFTITRSCITCITPTVLPVSNITSTTATLNWNAVTPAPATGYQYFVSTSSALPLSPGIATTATTVNISGLVADTTYYVFVRSDCGGGNFSTWSPFVSFVTGYCSSTSTSSTYYINNFSTTGGTSNITNNGSGYSATGYGNFTAMTVTQQNNGTINFSTNFFNGTNTYGFNIWVDWNNDLDFNDAGELVYASGAFVTGATGSFIVPSSASAGNHRMRIVANYFSTNPSSCGSISSGETEDYTVVVTPAPCPGIPSNVTISALTQTTATLNWTASSPAPTNGYQYFLSTNATAPNGSTIPTGSVGAGITTVNLTGLSPDTTYYVYVRNNCNGIDFSAWTPVVSFITGYCASNSTSSTYYINNFSTSGGSSNIANNGTGYSAGGYGNFTSQSVSQINLGSISFNAVFFNGTYTYGFNIWVDWNNDLDFNDAGELVYASGAYVTSATGSFIVPAGASIGNHRMRIVANYLSTNPNACGTISSGETEDYTLTVLPPLPCSGNPNSISVVVTSQTTATVQWVEPASPPANGYQYFLSTSNSTPSSGATPTGSVGFGITSANLTGLTSGLTYFIWVRSNCGGGLGQGVWVGPISFTQPNCSLGSGNGTTTQACPNVLAGGLSLSGADPAAINACTTSTCVDLEATYTPINQSTNYSVQSIPYSPPYQFNCLRNPVSINVDDVWSSTINLPFQFCFYGNNYTQCLIGSNGVISFDLSTNTPGGYNAWSFNSNLPNTSLFRNTIFGVYHDIDPGVGGEVGWELVTLNNGCRALVAAWDDIPMYSSSCNSILYTGMIVLYETTNIIEVYVQEKNVCSTWNDGNAIIGIQNGNATQAVVAPNRNGLDPNWTTTNEAWRFSPSGVPVTTVTWREGSGSLGPIIGTGDTISVCPTSTTTYTAEVSYTICNGRTITRTDETTVTVIGNKVWNGSVDSDWNKNNNWTPVGIPNGTDCVTVPTTANNPIISGANYVGLAGTLSILNGATLTVLSSNTIAVTNQVTVNPTGTFIINDDASLVQINNPGIANIGNITMLRNTNIRNFDYVYWSSPVTTFNSGAISPGTPSWAIYKWNPTHNGTDYGIWIAGVETMVVGKGYIIRGPSSYSSTPANYTATFTGVPNNGNLSIPISRGTRTSTYASPGGTALADDDNWNLVGNPYPSALDANTFLSTNTNIDGNIRVWTHGQPINSSFSDPFYADYVYNYSINDYVTYNSMGSTPPGFLGKIGAGQGFFINMLHSTPSPSTVVFNNTMRNSTYNNSQFYRTSNSTLNNTEDKSRIWLSITNQNNATGTTLIGYAYGATEGKDRNFDASHKPSTNVELFSVLNDEPLIIQGRSMPFNQNDFVPLGYSIPSNGMYSIGINTVDGLFVNPSQNILLEDLQLDLIHNLKQSPYQFIGESGTHKNRFVLRYIQSTLGNNSFNENSIYVVSNNEISIASSNELIKTIKLHDVLGRLVGEFKDVNNLNFVIKSIQKNNAPLLLEIHTENNNKIVKKIIY